MAFKRSFRKGRRNGRPMRSRRRSSHRGKRLRTYTMARGGIRL